MQERKPEGTDIFLRQTSLSNCSSCLLKRVYCKRKEFAHPYFLLEVAPFQKGFGMQESKPEGTDIFSRETTLAKLFKVPSEKGSTLKGKNLLTL